MPTRCLLYRCLGVQLLSDASGQLLVINLKCLVHTWRRTSSTTRVAHWTCVFGAHFIIRPQCLWRTVSWHLHRHCNALGFRREFFRVANSLSIAWQHFALKLLFPSLAIGHHQIGLGYPTFASFVVWHHSSSQNVASFLHLYEAIRSNFKFRNSKRSSKFNKLYWINQRTRFWLKTVELNFLTWGIGTWFSNSNSRWW